MSDELDTFFSPGWHEDWVEEDTVRLRHSPCGWKSALLYDYFYDRSDIQTVILIHTCTGR